MFKWLFGNPTEIDPPKPFKVGDSVRYESNWGQRFGVVESSSSNEPDQVYILDKDWGVVIGVNPEKVFKL